ncbi:hypothetical protein GYB57_13005 [bacterium]|nr:hypothetical protein [bacterium]
MKIFCSILCLFLFNNIFSQSSESSTADLLFKNGKLKEAILLYDSIYKIDSNNRSNTYNYACAYALMGNKDSAFKYLFIATESDSMVQALNDPDFYFLITDHRWTEFENQMIAKIEAKHQKYVDPKLTMELWRMKIKDQAFYYHLKLADKQNGLDSPIIKALWELKHLINDENLDRLEEIIAENGWPKRSAVGSSAAQTVFLIIQHADLETQKKYLPAMKEAANEKEASWSSLALLIDRIEMREGRPQIYGSQISRDQEGNYKVFEMIEPEYVNQRRKEVGLPPLENYVKNWGITWEVEQKTK